MTSQNRSGFATNELTLPAEYNLLLAWIWKLQLAILAKIAAKNGNRNGRGMVFVEVGGLAFVR